LQFRGRVFSRGDIVSLDAAREAGGKGLAKLKFAENLPALLI